MAERFSGAIEGIARIWCKAMHPDPMWPIRGYYRCPECLRQYPVPWECPQESPAADIRSATLRPELLPSRLRTPANSLSSAHVG